jgi:peptidoglycan/xylan/chitin deacetylase (PgdA/CDA1 family)
VRDASASVSVGQSGFMRPPLVLAYHAIGDVPRELDPDGLVVPASDIRAQIERLREREYEFVTAREFARRLRADESLAGVCSLTFDDGSLDNATILPGILRALDVPATLYVCPGLLGKPHPWVLPEAGMRLMDLDELRAVAELPFIEIGSHTNNHLDLEPITDASHAYGELRSSKLAIEELIGRPVDSLAYPYGRYSSACPAAAERAGFTNAATCGLRGGWHPYELRRELIAPGDLSLRFELKIRGLFRPLVSSPPMRLRRRLRGRDEAPPPVPALR